MVMEASRILDDVKREDDRPRKPVARKSLKAVRDGNQAAVDSVKARIGERVKQLRGETSQEAIEADSRVGRTMIGHIERGSRDYRIDTLLRVLSSVKTTEELLLAPGPDPVEAAAHELIHRIMRHGNSGDRSYILTTLDRAAAAINRILPFPSK